MMDQINVATKDDLQKIAHCHCAAFPDSLATGLGLKYVELMLGWYVSSKNTFLIFIENKGQCVGYCGGMLKTIWGVGSASSMAQYSFNAAVFSFIKRPWLIFHPELRTKYLFIARNVINRFFRKTKLKGEPTVAFEPYVGLVVIGVDPSFQGKGYGSLLLKEFEDQTRQRELKKIVLSVLTKNHQAIKSYLRNGWVVSKVDGKSTSMEKLLK
jgi:ribosomal protein S18 acetylase RimI-like enzyme